MRLEWEKLVTRRSDFWKNYMMMRSLQDLKVRFGSRIERHIIERHGMEFTHWMHTSSVRYFSEATRASIDRDAGYVARISRMFKTDAAVLRKECDRLARIDCGSLSREGLLRVFHSFCDRYRELYPCFHLSAHAPTVEENARERLECAVQKRRGTHDMTSYFDALCTPDTPSLQEQEEVALLRLALKKRSLGVSVYKKLLDRHIRHYEGLPVINDETPAFSRSYFTRRIAALSRKTPTALRAELKQYRTKQTRIRSEKKRITRLLHLDQRTQRYVSFIAQATWIRLAGRTLFAVAHHASRPLFAELGRRTGRSADDIKWLTVPEIEQLLVRGIEPSAAQLRNRKTNVLLEFRNGAINIKEGMSAGAAIESILGEYKKEKGRQLKGTVAYPGSATGRVRIVLSHADIPKMKKGDILVARMTTVDLIPAIRRAVAIITDEGGVTCHAAIVARELKIPCIIGTKNATALLKDGKRITIKNGIIYSFENYGYRTAKRIA
ncbi:hypothetical protein HY627_00230 [Candidatus Uhrbacteria bacterium]|nr:hypothetical protein [Candidatus Uhrbacteria bacterium]